MRRSHHFYLLVVLTLAAALLVTGLRLRASDAGQELPAAVSDPADRRERIARVSGEVLSGTEVERNLRTLCDEIGGRVSGTEAGLQARLFVERLLNEYGLSGVHQEPFGFMGWERGEVSCEVTEPEHHGIHAVALGNTPSTPEQGIEAPVIDAGHGNPIELERLGEAVRGRFALVVSGAMPGGRWMHRSEVMAEVAARGAAGLLYQTSQAGDLPMTGTCSAQGTSLLPGVGISLEDGEYIRRRLGSGGEVRVRVVMTNRSGPAESANVIGEIPGRGSDFVLVSAHLDSWNLGQGAVDNGTGTVVVLEAARALAAARFLPEVSIRFAFFMGEELGLVGSREYARAHEEELPRCRAMINCDMTGMPVGIRVMGHEGAHSFFEELAAALNGFDLTSGISYRVGIYGDHQPFLLKGVPVVTPRSRLEDDCWRYYHTSADTYDKVGIRQLNLEAAFVAAIALELASTPGRVMEHLDAAGVRKLVTDHNLGEALRFWGHGDF